MKWLIAKQGNSVRRVSLSDYCKHASKENCATARALKPGESVDLVGADGKPYTITVEGRGKRRRGAAMLPGAARRRKSLRAGAGAKRRAAKRKRALHIPLPLLIERRERLEQLIGERTAAGENGKQV